MLKTLKWVYGLGVKQERVRIARELENQAAMLNNEYGVEHDMLRELGHENETKAKMRRLQRLELKHATTHRLQEIINNILQPRHEPSTSISVMFPDDKEPK